MINIFYPSSPDGPFNMTDERPPYDEKRNYYETKEGYEIVDLDICLHVCVSKDRTAKYPVISSSRNVLS